MSQTTSLIAPLFGAIVSAAMGAWCGIETPGLWGIVMYASICVVAFIDWSDQKRPLWQMLLVIAAMMPLVVSPTRLLAVGLRNLGGVHGGLDRIALCLTAFWLVLGASYASRCIFSGVEPAGSGGMNGPSNKTKG